ncbi:MAG: PAS domain S-box protein, partial [Acidobacteria bacterium]|nr:PAS domain S-box protein [Acidobacteriota bacterium]
MRQQPNLWVSENREEVGVRPMRPRQVNARQETEVKRQVLEAVPDALLLVNADGRIIDLNRCAEKLFGYSREELLGKIVEILLPERFRSAHACHRKQFFAEPQARPMGSDLQVCALKKDRSEFPVDINLSPIETGEGVLTASAIRDIREPKKLENLLKTRMGQQAAVAELSQLALADTGLSELLNATVGRVSHVLGVEFCKVLELLPGGQALRLRAGVGWKEGCVGHATVGAERDSQAGYTLLSDGPVIVEDLRSETRFSGPALLHDHGVVSGMSVVICGKERRFGVLGAHTAKRRAFTEDDIQFLQIVANMLATAIERRQAEEALRNSEESHRLLFESAPLPMWVCDLETLAFLAVNDAAVRHFGYSRDEFLAMTTKDIRPPEDVPALMQRLAEATPGFRYIGTQRFRKKDGAIIHLESMRHTLAFAGRNAALVLQNDVTQLRNLEEQLRWAQKMEVVGRLAGGIAHDFNNLLTGILGYAELLLGGMDPKSPVAQDIAVIRGLANGAANLTRQLLAFGRHQTLQPVVVNLNALVENTAQILRQLIGEDIDLTFFPAADLGNVRVDPGQIEQVLINLVINARDAMPHGGKLTIETANVEMDRQYAATHAGVKPGDYVMVAATDTGCGMDQATQRLIFEPFFTTKEPGKGSGLGLSTAYGIVKQHGGDIWVYSEPGRGTTFKIYLPRVEVEAKKVAPSTREEPPAPGAGETILIVEDDNAVRTLVQRVLDGHGYRVLCAASPDEAEAVVASG